MILKDLIDKLREYDENLPVASDEFQPNSIDEIVLTFYHPEFGETLYRKELFDEMVRDAAADVVQGWTTMNDEEDAEQLSKEYNEQVKKYYDEAKTVILLDGHRFRAWRVQWTS